MTEPSESILRKIQAMLDRAAHPNTPESEVEACTKKAAAWMATYGIQQALLADAGKREDEVGVTEIPLAEPYGLSKLTLMHHIAEALRCKVVRRRIGQRKYVAHVLGYASDRERVEFLYTSLLLQATTAQNRLRGYSAGETRSMRTSYLNGFAVTVGERLEEAERRAAGEQPVAESGRSTELVLVDRNAAVARRFVELFPKLPRVNSRTGSRAGYELGRHDGTSADIGSARVQNRRTRAIGG